MYVRVCNTRPIQRITDLRKPSVEKWDGRELFRLQYGNHDGHWVGHGPRLEWRTKVCLVTVPVDPFLTIRDRLDKIRRISLSMNNSTRRPNRISIPLRTDIAPPRPGATL